MSFESGLKRRESGLLTDGERKFVPGEWTRNREGTWAEGRELGTWYPESKRIGSRAEGARGFVDVEKVGQVVRGCVVEAFVANGIKLIVYAF